jgi:hypothetical protein
LRSIDQYREEVLLTLAAVFGGYAVASRSREGVPRDPRI